MIVLKMGASIINTAAMLKSNREMGVERNRSLNGI